MGCKLSRQVLRQNFSELLHENHDENLGQIAVKIVIVESIKSKICVCRAAV